MQSIGIVEYINALPFHLPFRLGVMQTNIAFTYGTPNVLNQSLREGKLDCALTSASEYLDGTYHLIPGMCIGGYQEILSVNLYTRGPLVDDFRIGLTNHSAISSTLLKVLCHHFWKVNPQFVSLDQDLSDYEGFLLIGDAALKQRFIPGYQTIDLAAAWYEATGLPFVFAVFSVRKGVSYKADEFQRALYWSETHRKELVEAAHQQSGLPKPLINRYYDICNYHLGEKELEGLHLFQNLREHVSSIYS